MPRVIGWRFRGHGFGAIRWYNDSENRLRYEVNMQYSEAEQRDMIVVDEMGREIMSMTEFMQK